MKSRNVNIDLLRIVSMCLVVCIHTAPKPFGNHPLLEAVFSAVIFLCNGCFFMISGSLNLKKEFQSGYDWIRYYSNRFVSVVFPFLLCTVTMYMWNAKLNGIPMTFKNGLSAVLNDFSSSHLWFVYGLICYILATPLLSRAFHAMEDSEIKALFIICVIYNIIRVYLTSDFGISFAFGDWIFSGWLLYYFAGYYVQRIINEKNKKMLYLFGTLGFIITVIGTRFLSGHFNNPYDNSVVYLFFVMAVYYFVINKVRINHSWMQNIVAFVAKHTYTIYLIHWMVIISIVNKFEFLFSNIFIVAYIEKVLLTIVISLIISVVVDAVILRPCSKMIHFGFNKLIKKDEG